MVKIQISFKLKILVKLVLNEVTILVKNEASVKYHMSIKALVRAKISVSMQLWIFQFWIPNHAQPFIKRLAVSTNEMNKDLIGNYIFKVNNRNTTTRREISSKLTIKTLEWDANDDLVLIVKFEHYFYFNFEQINTRWGCSTLNYWRFLQ